MIEAGGDASEQIQMKLREVDPIIRPLSIYADFILSKAPDDRNISNPKLPC
jgi:hypothetical protein